MKTFVRFLLASSLVAGLACSSDSGPDYASEIDESNMEGAAETSYDFVQDVVYGMMQGSPTADLPLAPPFEGSTFADRLLLDIRARGVRRSGRSDFLTAPPLQPVLAVCEAVETGVDDEGDPIDTDDDGIPDDYKLSFPANCSETEGDVVYTYSGSVRVRDVAGLYGYRIDIANLKYREEEVGTDDLYSFAVNGSEAALYSSSGATHSTHLTYTTTFTASVTAPAMASASASTASYKFSWDEETAFDPEGILSLESEIPGGDFDIDLTFRAVFSGFEEDLALKFRLTTPEELHFDTGSCEGIDDGQIRGELNGNDDIYFTVTWTGCGSTTYEAHGTTDGETLTARTFAPR